MLDYKKDIIDKFISSNNQNRVGDSEINSILNNDVKLIQDSYLEGLINVFKDILLFLFALVLLLRINVFVTIVIFVLGISLIFIPKLFVKKNQNLKENYSKDLRNFTEKIKEISQGFDVIKGFNIENKIKKLVNEKNENLENSKYKSEKFEGIISGVSSSMAIFVFLINMLISAYLVFNNKITAGQMIAIIQLLNFVVNPITSVAMYKTKIDSVYKIIKKIDDNILKNEVEEKTKKFNFNEEIEIKDLSYSYDGEVNTLDSINLNFQKGKKYLLVGESGSGKSTLMKILLNQITNYKGFVKIDNEEIKEMNSKSFYEKVTLIQQKIFMFKDSIKNNICLYGNCNLDKLEDVIEKSGLNKLIEKQEEGLETVIGEDARQLSGGEFQRVAIARSLIKDSEILLVDEATAALDKIISTEIEKTILSLNKTIIAISHKLEEEILTKYDEIIVMKDGKIAEIGSFEKLLEEKGYFYYMYNFK